MTARWRHLLPVLAAIACLGAATARAHPHAWIDLTTSLRFDAAGRLEAIVVDWLFDDFYSAYVIEDIARAGEPPQAALDEVAAKNLENLRDYGYFTEIRVDGQRRPVEAIGSHSTGMRGKRLWLRFEVPLPEPVDPRAHEVTYAIYDPTYYIEILHPEGDVVPVEGDPTGRCRAEIEPADVTAEVVALAAALDRSAKAPDTLGRQFADTALVRCD